MKKNKKIIAITLLIIFTLVTFGTVYAAFTSTVEYTKNMTMPQEIIDMIGG